MKNLIIILFIPVLLSAQYWGERTTEQSFEQSELYFTSHFLNTFGIYRFKDIAPGLIDDPFLNLYINPANIPSFEDKEMLIYLDFRGDRTEEPILDIGINPGFYRYGLNYMSCIPPDPRWISTTRSEPEPIVSFGILAYPIAETTKKLFAGATYQLIHKEEPFYTMPYWIYNSRYLSDPFGGMLEPLTNVPIEDRYSGADEMSNEGHLFSGFVGYKLSDNISLGLGLNSVLHTRDGKYLDSNNDEYGDTDNYEWNSHQSQVRKQDYDHLDINLGINYKLSSRLTTGLKIGQLSGKADQDYISGSSYLSKQNIPHISTEWQYYFSDASTKQKWEHNGNTKYISLNLERKIDEKKILRGYYRYSFTDIDVANNSVITDTSYSTSRWISTHSSTQYDYLNQSSTSDIRSGSGKRKKYIHQAMLNISWKLTPNNSINAGIYAYKNETKVVTSEPAIVRRYSEYEQDDSQGAYYHDLRELKEDKRLDWRFKSMNWSIQIPIILNFRLSDNWGMMLGVNRILESWKIEEQTIAYFKERERNEDGVIRTETNFGERYTQPTEKISEDFTDIIAGFDVVVSSELKIKLLLDPEFENEFRVAQWWLGFEARM